MTDFETAAALCVTTDEIMADGASIEAILGAMLAQEMEPNRPPYVHVFGPDDCRCDSSSVECPRHASLTDSEWAAVSALHESDIEVGMEGIGGFAAGQAEDVMLVLHKAGFTVSR